MWSFHIFRCITATTPGLSSVEGKSLEYFPSTITNSNNLYLNKTIEQRSSQDNVDYPSIASSIVTGLFFNAYLNKEWTEVTDAMKYILSSFKDRYYYIKGIKGCYLTRKTFLYSNRYNFNNTKVMLDDLVFTAHYLQTWIQNYVIQFLPFIS